MSGASEKSKIQSLNCEPSSTSRICSRMLTPAHITHDQDCNTPTDAEGERRMALQQPVPEVVDLLQREHVRKTRQEPGDGWMDEWMLITPWDGVELRNKARVDEVV